MQYLLQAGLLEFDPQVGVLDALPPSSRRSVIAEVTSAMAPNPALAHQLTTAAHVKWFLECIGAAFSLELEDISTIQSAAAIFTAWLNRKDDRPAGWAALGADTFFTTILRMLSTLFVPRRLDSRSQTTGATSKHADLCQTCIRQLLTFIQSDELTAAAKVQYLRMVVGICDSLLALPAVPFCYLAEDLPDGLLRLCLTTFLQFESFDDKSWSFLLPAYHRWMHRPQAIGHWQSVTLAVSEALLDRLYCRHQINEQQITYEGEAVILKDGKFLSFVWDKLIGLLPAPSRIASPANYCRAVAAVEKVVALLTCTQSAMALAPAELPGANTILSIFGEWLFEAILQRQSEDGNESDGRAMAIGILCRIFAQPPHDSPVLPVFLEQFFAAIHSVCTAPSKDLFPLVMMMASAEDLFAVDLAGSRVLLESMVFGIRRIVPSTDEDLVRLLGRNIQFNFADLRRSCYKILGSLFSSVNHYSDLPSSAKLVQSFPKLAIQNGGGGYYSDAIRKIFNEAHPTELGSLKAAIFETICISLLVEKESENTRYLLSLFTAFVVDDALVDPEVCSLAVKLLAELLEQERWAADVCPSAFLALSQLAKLQPTVSAASRERPRKLVLSLCRFGEGLMAADSPISRSVLSGLVETIVLWCLEGDWLDNDFECQSTVFALLADMSAHISVQPNFVDRVQEKAESAVGRLALHCGLSKVASDYPNRLSSALHVPKPGAGLAFEHGQAVTLLSADHPPLASTHYCPQGAFSFHYGLEYGSLASAFVPEDPVAAFESPSVAPLYTPANIFMETPNYNQAVFASVAEGNEELNRRLQDLSLLISSLSIDKVHATPQTPFRGKPADTERDLATIFLSQTLLRSERPFKALAITDKDSVRVKKALDTTVSVVGERESLKAALLFVRSGDMSVQDILAPQPVTLDFADFCGSLGWCNKHEIVFKDHSLELTITCPTLLPKFSDDYVGCFSEELDLDGRAAFALAQLAGAPVTVVWVEEPGDLMALPAKLLAPSTVYLVIQPMRHVASNGLYRIRILVLNNDTIPSSCIMVFGPLLDGMIVRRAVLGDLVRQTVCSAVKYLEYAGDAQRRHPIDQRREQLSLLCNTQSDGALAGRLLLLTR